MNYKINFDDTNYKNHLIFLFADLYQISKKIIKISNKNNIIVLIGDTPSYLKFFLKNKRKIVNIPASAKPFGCVLYKDTTCETNNLYVPTLEELNGYFRYLSEDTILTKDFMKKNWENIILVDTSSGDSIHGMSLLFNLYVDNVKIIKDNECNIDILCNHIDNAKPLKFINLGNGFLNKNPSLINEIKHIYFAYKQFFIIHEAFPRFVPEYYKNNWINKPVFNYDSKYKKIKKLYRRLLKTKDNSLFIKLSKNIENKEMFLTDNYKDTLHNLIEIINNCK